MKKSLIALAALAAVSAVSAQSTVSVYGRLDLGYSTAKQTNSFGLASSGTDEFQSQDTKSTSFGNNNARTTSRLGFSGTEDLGGGLKAMFNYEIGLAPDNIGTKNGTTDETLKESSRVGFGGTRLANLAVSGGFGTVVLGTFLNAHDALRGYSVHTNGMAGGDFMARHNAQFTDAGTTAATFTAAATAALGNSALFENGDTAATTGTVLSNTAQALKAINGIGLNGRSHNAVGYTSPVMSGFSVGVGFQSDKTNRGPTTQATDSRSINGQTFSLNYAQGPLKAMYVTGTGKNVDKDFSATSAYSSTKAKDSGFAASYDLGVAQVFLVNEGVKANIYGALLDGYTAKTNATEVGVKFPMGAFTPYALMGSGKITINDGTEATVFKTKATQVGTTYDLSKRSSMYLSIGRDEMIVDGLGLKRTGTTAGLIHTF